MLVIQVVSRGFSISGYIQRMKRIYIIVIMRIGNIGYTLCQYNDTVKYCANIATQIILCQYSDTG